MNRIRYTNQHTDITDEQLWRTLRAPAGRAGREHLQRAIELGKAGRRAPAYQALGEYHRIALADEWEHIQQQYADAADPDPDVLRDLLNHRIRCWHNLVVDFDRKIDWFPEHALPRDAINGFNYFQWFVPAVTAYVRNGDEEVGAFLRDILEQYYAVRHDPRWCGPNDQYYKNFVFNQLGVGGRLPRLLAAYLALLQHGAASPAVIEAMAKQVLGFARVIEPQNKRFVAHNIQTHGCRALLQMARLFPEYRQSPRWDRFACLRLRQQVTEGYFKDGCQRERVWGYSAATLRSITEAYDLAMRLGGLGDDQRAFLRGMRHAYRFYAKTAGPRPALRMPSYGDAGEGSSARGILERGRQYFPKSTDENLGVDRTHSYLLKDSGFAIFRNGDDENAMFMDLTFGPFTGWHSHYDLMSMNVYAYGRPVLDELCRFGPYSIPLDPTFKSPEAHNLLTIDGMVYDNRHVRGEDVAWHSDEQVDYFSATHRAYQFYCFGNDGWVQPNINAEVRRTVVFVKDPGYALILDSVTDLSHPDSFSRAITQRWHSPLPLRQHGATVARTKGRGPGVLMAWAHREGLVRLETGADFTHDEVAHYGKAYERHYVHARRWMPLERTTGISGFATLVFPFKRVAPDASIRALPGDAADMWRAECYEVSTPERADLIALIPEQRDGVTVNGIEVTGRAGVRLGKRGRTIDVP